MSLVDIYTRLFFNTIGRKGKKTTIVTSEKDGNREGERERENHHGIVEHQRGRERNERVQERINLYVKPSEKHSEGEREGRKMFAAHDINILTLNVVVRLIG